MPLEAQGKIEEAKFFLELVCQLEGNGQTLTRRTVQEEATYLVSALMNACYSVLEHLKADILSEVERTKGGASKIRIENKLGQSVNDFKARHPEIGVGQRRISVHYRSVTVERHTSGGAVYGSSRYGTSTYGSGRKVELRFGDCPRKPVTTTFRRDIQELEQFVSDAYRRYLPQR